MAAAKKMPSLPLHRYWSSVMHSMLAAAFILAIASCAFSQDSKPPSSDPVLPSKKSDSDPRFGSPENEMRAKAILKEEKKRYEENLDRAREVSELATQLSESFAKNNSFNSEDGKKLERLEKLTKRIRNEAGGSDSEPKTELKDICATMVDTIKHLAEMAEELHKLVDKTPRNVISAAVIDQANRVIGVTQHLRSSR